MELAYTFIDNFPFLSFSFFGVCVCGGRLFIYFILFYLFIFINILTFFVLIYEWKNSLLISQCAVWELKYISIIKIEWSYYCEILMRVAVKICLMILLQFFCSFPIKIIIYSKNLCKFLKYIKCIYAKESLQEMYIQLFEYIWNFSKIFNLSCLPDSIK